MGTISNHTDPTNLLSGIFILTIRKLGDKSDISWKEKKFRNAG